jgi:hypothetical protein
MFPFIFILGGSIGKWVIPSLSRNLLFPYTTQVQTPTTTNNNNNKFTARPQQLLGKRDLWLNKKKDLRKIALKN